MGWQGYGVGRGMGWQGHGGEGKKLVLVIRNRFVLEGDFCGTPGRGNVVDGETCICADLGGGTCFLP